MRQIALDTETTGLSHAAGHRLIEIGCVEIINRRLTGKTFHIYLQPDREIDPGATQVHGITNAHLEGKPRFKDIVEDFKGFIKDAELIIHNAPFDVGFIENEFRLINDLWEKLDDYCLVTDTLVMARKKHPGQRNNLDALCKRYNVDNQHREKHGALLDAEILAQLYLTMTGGQNALILEETQVSSQSQTHVNLEVDISAKNELKVIFATEEEILIHEKFLNQMEKKGAKVLFKEKSLELESDA